MINGKLRKRRIKMEHKCYDEKSIWVYINYEEDTTQIFIELGRLEYVRDHFNSIVSIEFYFMK